MLAADKQHDEQLKRSDDEHWQANIASLSATVRGRGWGLGLSPAKGPGTWTKKMARP